MNTQKSFNSLEQNNSAPDNMVLMEVPVPSPIWVILVQSGWRMIDVKEDKALLTRDYIQA